MSSNFQHPVSANPNNGLLSYSFKNMNLNHFPNPVDGGFNSSSIAYGLSSNRPVANCTSDSFAPAFRMISRGNHSEFGAITNSSYLRIPSIANSSAASNYSTVPNGIMGLNDRISSLRNNSAENMVYRAKTSNISASRVLSNLQDTTSLALGNTGDNNPSYILGNFGTENPVTRSNRMDGSCNMIGLTDLTATVSEPDTLAALLTSSPKPVIPSFTPSTLSALSKLTPVNSMSDSIGASRTPLDLNGPSVATSGYYTAHQLAETRDMQATGFLKAARWILVPPVPEGTAAHMFTGRVHEVKAKACAEKVFNSAYMDHGLKQILQNKLEACLFTSADNTKDNLPRNLGAYTDLVPLETMNPPRVSVTFELPSVCIKAWSPRFNRPMLLRRMILPSHHEPALSPEVYVLAKQLSEVDHPAVVGFRDVFFTNAFDDHSMIFVYEYCPCSTTIQQAHMNDPMKLTSFSSPFNIARAVRPHSSLKSGPSELGMLPESTVWSYVIQLTHGLRFIHRQLHMACGNLDPTKVLIQEGTRIRINCFGMKDILPHQPHELSLEEEQMLDLVHLGNVVIGAACGTSEALQSGQRATVFNLLQRSYRTELVNLLRGLVLGQITSIEQLLTFTAPFVYDHMTNIMDHSDFLERQLFLSMECDRLFRLVCKLQSIVERHDPEGPDADWAETGDRYMLKLFRDFLFHQSDQLGAPYLDMAHIISTLNKVASGSTDRLCLVSRDSQNVIIVTYADVKQWLETSFQYLLERHRQSRCDIQLAQQEQQREARLKQVNSKTETSQPINVPSSDIAPATIHQC